VSRFFFGPSHIFPLLSRVCCEIDHGKFLTWGDIPDMMPHLFKLETDIFVGVLQKGSLCKKW
jgi:hypothetical protein